jgi:transmembrane sensor
MSNQSRLQLLFARYLQRACSPQEVEELISLLHQGDADNVLDAQMRAVWEQHTNNQAANTVNWKNMYESITSTREKFPSLSRHSKWMHWRRYAAAATLLPLLGMGIYWFFGRETALTHQQPVAGNTTIPIKKQVAATRQTIHLPDGSTVILNEESRLNYPSVFTGKSRNVYLTGEGFFDIQHNPRQPFIVHTGKISIKVLGTAFNVKTLPLSQDIEVTVTRGKVQVLNEDKSIGIITASQQLSYISGTGYVTKATVDTLPVLAWKPAEIFFNDISMEEVASRLEKRFAVNIEFSNPAIKNCRVSATFSEDDLPEEILAVVCAVSKSAYTITNKKIIINGKGCN